MTQKELIQVLMLSPFYFRLPLSARKMLIEEVLSSQKPPSAKPL